MKLARHLPRFRQAEAALPRWTAREGWPREKIEEYQLEALNSLWERAMGAPHWRELVDRGEAPTRFESLAELADLPILSKGEVRRLPIRFLAAGNEEGSWHRTSGASGSPMGVWWPGSAYRRVLQAKYRSYRSRGVGMFDRTAFLMRPSWSEDGAAARWCERARLELENRLRNRRWEWLDRLGPREVNSALDRLERFDPVMIYGYSRSLAVVAEEARRGRRRFPSLAVVVLTSEPATRAVVAAVEGGFGAPVAVEYGATECGMIAFQDASGTMRVREDLVIVETLPRLDGRWDIALTILCNPGFPLLRYAIGDVVDRPLDKPARGFASFGCVGGREDDFLVDGTDHLVDSAAIDSVFEREDGVRRFRVRQREDGTVEADVEVVVPGGADLGRMTRRLEALVKGMPVAVRIVDAIRVPEGGKHRVVTSDMVSRPTWERVERPAR